MEGNVHAALLLSTILIGAALCWRYRGLPNNRVGIGLRLLAAVVVLAGVWVGSAGMFQCLCGPGNNPVTQGLLPAAAAAVGTFVVRDWKPKLATIALMLALGYGLSWHFHWLVLEQPRATQRYAGADMLDEMPPESELWHTPLTGLYRYLPPPPRENELQRAARERDLDRVRALIQKGFPLDERSRDGDTALHLAASRNGVEIVKVLLDAGADVNATSFARETALHSASLTGALAAADLLLARGANVNARSTNGATPLCHAASGGHQAVVEVLLARGANIDLQESRFSPLNLAISRGHEGLAEYLLEKGAAISPGDLETAVYRRRHRMAAALIARGADIEAGYSRGYPLLLASRNGDLEMVRLLVEGGADVNAKRESIARKGADAPATPLEVAGSEEVRQYLILKGAKQ